VLIQLLISEVSQSVSQSVSVRLTSVLSLYLQLPCLVSTTFFSIQLNYICWRYMNFRTVFTCYLLITVVNLLLYKYYCIICTKRLNYFATFQLHHTFYVCFYWLKHAITKHYDMVYSCLELRPLGMKRIYDFF